MRTEISSAPLFAYMIKVGGKKIDPAAGGRVVCYAFVISSLYLSRMAGDAIVVEPFGSNVRSVGPKDSFVKAELLELLYVL